MPIARRRLALASLLCLGSVFAAGCAPPAQAAPAAPPDFEQVTRLASERAASGFEPVETRLPEALDGLGYDQLRDIRHRPDARGWRGESDFGVALFHPGGHYRTPVRIHRVDDRRSTPWKLDPTEFDYGANVIPDSALVDMDPAGFRLHYPLNNAAVADEVIAFHGASYFRALGRGQQYGLSARGLAIDTGRPQGEEFPAFVEAWLLRPAPDARRVEVLALLDSPAVAGAYRFVIEPGRSTSVDVTARLFFRHGVETLGIAPLTSMFLFGENQPPPRPDYRPEVHDSDGLLLNTGAGEWLWRPLVNPARMLVTGFADRNPRGFGLLQRDRGYRSYEDPEARYDLRPSAWIEPLGDWGEGRVELVALPTPDETNDNIVAYWVPAVQPQPGTLAEYRYRIHWSGREPVPQDLARVVQTRFGRGYGDEGDPARIGFMVDFEAPALAGVDAAALSADVWTGGDTVVVEQQLFRNPATGELRLRLLIDRKEADEPTELRGVLQFDHKTVSETWSYVIPAD